MIKLNIIGKMLREIKYSIVIPTYNRAYCIEDTIESILRQNYNNYEIIIIDDNSNDGTENVISKYENIVYKKLKNNGGPNIARNIGAEISKGDWLIFLDSDDLLIDRALKKINLIIFEEKCDLLFVPCESVDGNKTNSLDGYEGVVTYKEYIRKRIKGRPFKGEFLPCVKKEVFLKNKFFEDIIGGEGLTWMKITKNYSFFISNQVCRLYNNVSDDRLSILTKQNLRRILKVKIFDIKNNFFDYLKLAPFKLLLNLLKITYYQFQIFFK